VAGGFDAANNVLASAEVYDPLSGTWSAAGSMTTAHHNHAATLLADGRVLVSGGLGPAKNPIATAELYNPATGTRLQPGV
jgi:hypothetical protein